MRMEPSHSLSISHCNLYIVYTVILYRYFVQLHPVTSACQNMDIQLIYTPPPGIAQSECDPTAMQKVEMGSIQCIGVGACVNMKLSIRNMGCDRVELRALECREGSCGGAQFDFQGAIDIMNCELAAAGAQPLGLERCYSNLRALICPDIGSCMNEKRTITDPANGFQVCLVVTV